MARAHRLALFLAAFTFLYVLLFFSVLPLPPFLDPRAVGEILPVVRLALTLTSVPSPAVVDEIITLAAISQCINTNSNITLQQIPWWALVSFGSYSLWSMGWGLWSFRDCPEAFEELMGVRCFIFIFWEFRFCLDWDGDGFLFSIQVGWADNLICFPRPLSILPLPGSACVYLPPSAAILYGSFLFIPPSSSSTSTSLSLQKLPLTSYSPPP